MKYIFVLFLFLSLYLEADYIAGVSRVKITPQYSVYLAGLGNNRKSEGVHDDIYATALYLSDGKTRLVILSLDLIGLFYEDIEKARKEAGRKNSLQSTDIIIACSHLHSGPDTLGLWGPNEFTSGVEEKYLQFVQQKIVEAIDIAIKSAKPATLKVGQTTNSEVAYNSRDENLLDPTVTMLFVEDKNGKSIANIVNYACHPEVLWSDNKLITSDFVHYLRELTEREIGGVTLFLNGALGGMVTPKVKEHTFAEAKRIGENLGQSILKAKESQEKIEKTKIIHRVIKIKLPVENPKFLLAAQLEIMKRNMEGQAVDSEMHFLDIGGKLQILTNPGEALPKVGLALKSLLSTPYKMVIGLACDEIGYILPEEYFATQIYAYESSMSLGPKTAKILLQAGKRLLK
ncbi:neutral/alkaline non-lysosomal ceramidase N-terminal domain-containing protein [bacterium]|nr:neutral/alkaline non-lysosomal ceramidase N-terminal domain-containing protein [bacterium]